MLTAFACKPRNLFARDAVRTPVGIREGYGVDVFGRMTNGRFTSVRRPDISATMSRALEGKIETKFGDSNAPLAKRDGDRMSDICSALRVLRRSLHASSRTQRSAMDFFVNMHNGIHNHYMVNESEFAAEGVNWPVTMAKLADKHCPKGPLGGRLEINSHGWPAQILLQPNVTLRNLEQFAAAVRRLIKPGSAIEILACWIAAFPANAVEDELAATHRHPPAPVLPRPAATSRGLVLAVKPPPPPKPALTGAQIRLLALHAIATGKELLFSSSYTGTRNVSPATEAYNDAVNGPLFCSRLAKRTGCFVRAGMVPQAEEGENSGNAWFNTPIGDWEGHILDFSPTGDVKYVGFNVPRPVFRTHDMYGDGPLRVS